MEWRVEFYKDSKGNEPVKAFLNALSEEARAKVARLIKLLAHYGVLLKEPYTKQIQGKIRELRIADQRGALRVLYFAYTGKRLILLHGFIKKIDKTPPQEIVIAEKRMQDFILRSRETL